MREKTLVGNLSEEELRVMIPQLQDLTDRYKRTESIQKTLYNISELSSSASNLEELYQNIHAIVQGFMTADNFFVAFFDKENDKIKFDYFIDENDQNAVTEVPYEKIKNGVTAYILRSGEILELTKENLFEQAKLKGFQPLGTPPVDLIGIPLKRGNDTIGAMVVQSYNDEVRYDDDDTDILNFISRHIVTAVDRVKHRELTEQLIRQRTFEIEQSNLRLTAEIAERRRMEALQKALFEISELSVTTDKIYIFYGKLHDILNRLMHAPNCYIAELDDDKTKLSFPYFVGQKGDTADDRELGRGLTEYVIRQQSAVLIDSVKIRELRDKGEVDPEICQTMLEKNNCWLGAPLQIKNNVAGVIAIQTYGMADDYQQSDLDILRFVSNHIAVAMERRRAALELRNYNKHLSQMVKDRTAALDESNQSLKKQIEQRKEIEARLVHDAHHDALTGLPNRVLFNKRLELAIASKQRYEHYNYALLFIDLDRFKAINDSLGHHAGDDFLKDVSQRIDNCKRSHDLLARLGGDEFVVLLDSYESISDVEHIAQRIVEVVSEPFDIEGKEVYSGASVGIVEITREYTQGDQALRDADAAMYHAKNLGRNRYIMFDLSMRNQLLREVAFEQEFRTAFHRRELTICIQPIVSASDGSSLYHELTLAWQKDETLINRAQFWEVAQSTGLHHAANQYLIELAINQLKVWQSMQATREYRLGITLYAEQMLHKGSYAKLMQLIESTKVDTRYLVIELAEQSLNKFTKHLSDVVHKLRSIGIATVLDNFGNQSGSLNHLFTFEFDYIKLSASLTNSAHQSPHDLRMVESIIMVAEKAGIQVIADGIDSDDMRDMFTRLSCQYLQGSAVKEIEIL